MKILQTKRLILRTVKPEDIEALYEQIFNDEEVVKYTFGKELFDLEQTKKFIQENCNFDKNTGLSTLIEKETKKIIGLAGIIECNYLHKKDYEFGFILGKNFWKKGYATEIGRAQIQFAKEELKAIRVLALVHKENTGSIKTIEKLGLNYIKTIDTNGRGKREVYLI